MTLRRMLKKLRLKPGDIVILRDDSQVWKLVDAGKSLALGFGVPILIERKKGDITKMNFERLEEVYLSAKRERDGAIQKSN